MRNKTVQIIILFVIFAGVGFVIYQNLANAKNPVRAGQVAPDFTLVTTSGQEISLSDYQGKAVMLNFWASYCEPCRNEMPAIQKKYEEFKDQIEVIGINTGENGVTASGFLTSLKNVENTEITFPIVLDRNLDVTKLYQIGPIPVSIFITPEGIINKVVIGEMNEQMVDIHMRGIISK